MENEGLRLSSRNKELSASDDTDDSHCHTDKNRDELDKKARRQLLIASAFCCIFMVGETVGGALAHSLAIMSDAAHLLTDFASFGISLMAMYLASRQRTKKLSFGWYRAEIIGALMSILFLWILTGVLVYLGVQRILHQNYEINATIMLITASCGVVINIIMGATLHQKGHHHSHGGGSSHSHGDKTRLISGEGHLSEYGAVVNQDARDQRMATMSFESDHSLESGHSHDSSSSSVKREKNINVRAAFVHVIGDLVQSFGVLIAAIMIYFRPEWKIADPICTFLFSVLVIFTTMSIVKDIVHVLMEGAPRTVDFVEISKSLFEVSGVQDVHDLRMWSLSMNKVAMAVHLAIDRQSDPMKILKQSSQTVRSKFGISESIIQIEIFNPGMSDCQHCRDPPD